MFNSFSSFARSGLGKIVLTAMGLGAVYEGYQLWAGSTPHPTTLVSGSGSWSPSPIQGPASSPAAGQTMVSNEVVAFSFIIANGYATKGPVVLVGDKADYNDPTLTTVAINKTRFAQQLGQAVTDGSVLVGHQISGKGRKGLYKGRPQIVADEIQIK